MITQLIRQANWGHIWKFTQGWNHSNAVNVTMQLIMQTIWGGIWKNILRRNEFVWFVSCFCKFRRNFIFLLIKMVTEKNVKRFLAWEQMHPYPYGLGRDPKTQSLIWCLSSWMFLLQIRTNKVVHNVEQSRWLSLAWFACAIVAVLLAKPCESLTSNKAI